MFLLREVHRRDLAQLEKLAEKLNTLNLPANREKLEQIVLKSRQSFEGEFDELQKRQYVFVLVERDAETGNEKIVGTSMIVAQHGTYERPAVFFNLQEEQKYSETLDTFFEHEVLQLEFNYHGPTEIGGLILDPDYRNHRFKLGKLLSFVRFLFIGMHREWFRDKIEADLLPPLREDGTSDLWENLGKRFTNLSYREADALSRDNVEFIRSLFPSSPIYTTLLPEHVSNLIGKVGEKTKPVEKMLRDIGFEFDDRIDPFDGGPTFAVDADFCLPVQRTETVRYGGRLDKEEEEDGIALVAAEPDTAGVRFHCTLAGYVETPTGVRLRSTSLGKLRLTEGERVGYMPLTGPDLKSLY